jgi:peptide/nickel transport system substrate-binding protein
MGDKEASLEEMMRSDTTKKAKPGGIFNTSMSIDLPGLDPHRSSSFLSQMMAGYYYSRLLKLATGPGVDPGSATVGDAAQSVETTDEGQTWVFRLREEMRFHPRGPASVSNRPLQAEDVAASYSYFASTNVARKILEDLVLGLETPDTRTVVFRLKEPYAPFQELIASPSLLWIMSREAVSGMVDSQAVEGVAGTGPWMLEDVRAGDGVYLSRNPAYYERVRTASGERSLPLMDGVKSSTVADPKELQARFLAGDQHVIGHPMVGNDEVLEFHARGRELPPPLAGTPAWQLSMFFFNLANPANVFRDERLRRAFSMACDRDALIERFGNVSALGAAGYSIETGWNNSPIPWGSGAGSWWLDPKSAAMGYPATAPGKWYRHSPAEVTALLSAAGYGGDAVDIETTSGVYGPLFDDMAQAQAMMLTAAGLKTNLVLGDYRTKFFPEVFTKGNYAQAGFGFMTPYTTVDEYLFNMLMPEAARNLSKVDDPALTALVRKQRLELDAGRRQQLVYDIQKRCSDMMYYVPSVIGRWGVFTLMQRSVRNMKAFGTAGYGMGAEQLPHVWLDEDA